VGADQAGLLEQTAVALDKQAFERAWRYDIGRLGAPSST
jgi:hypothetical protein